VVRLEAARTTDIETRPKTGRERHRGSPVLEGRGWGKSLTYGPLQSSKKAERTRKREKEFDIGGAGLGAVQSGLQPGVPVGNVEGGGNLSGRLGIRETAEGKRGPVGNGGRLVGKAKNKEEGRRCKGDVQISRRTKFKDGRLDHPKGRSKRKALVVEHANADANRTRKGARGAGNSRDNKGAKKGMDSPPHRCEKKETGEKDRKTRSQMTAGGDENGIFQNQGGSASTHQGEEVEAKVPRSREKEKKSTNRGIEKVLEEKIRSKELLRATETEKGGGATGDSA